MNVGNICFPKRVNQDIFTLFFKHSFGLDKSSVNTVLFNSKGGFGNKFYFKRLGSLVHGSKLSLLTIGAKVCSTATNTNLFNCGSTTRAWFAIQTKDFQVFDMLALLCIDIQILVNTCTPIIYTLFKNKYNRLIKLSQLSFG